MSLLFDYMCMRLPFIPWSIAGVPSSQALLGFLITAPPSVCVPDVIGTLACGFQTKTKKRGEGKRTPDGAPTTQKQSLGSRIQSLVSVIGFFWVVTGKMSVFGTLSPLLTESAHGFTDPTHHEIADSFLVLFPPGNTMCAFCKEEVPTPPPSAVTPNFLGIWY